MQNTVGQPKETTSYQLYDASVAYFNWKKTTRNFKCIRNTSSMLRHVLKAIQSLIKQREQEPSIALKQELALRVKAEKLAPKIIKIKVKLSNFFMARQFYSYGTVGYLISEQQIESTIQETLKQMIC
jgi:hypothetical protein